MCLISLIAQDMTNTTLDVDPKVGHPIRLEEQAMYYMSLLRARAESIKRMQDKPLGPDLNGTVPLPIMADSPGHKIKEQPSADTKIHKLDWDEVRDKN